MLVFTFDGLQILSDFYELSKPVNYLEVYSQIAFDS